MTRTLIVGLLAVAGLSAAQGTQTFTGTITDDMCANGGHAQMRMGPTDAECVRACIVSHGAMYVLLDGKDVYTLSDQQTPEKFAAQKVTVVGTLDAKTKTIRVQSIAPRNDVKGSDPVLTESPSGRRRPDARSARPSCPAAGSSRPGPP